MSMHAMVMSACLGGPRAVCGQGVRRLTTPRHLRISTRRLLALEGQHLGSLSQQTASLDLEMPWRGAHWQWGPLLQWSCLPQQPLGSLRPATCGAPHAKAFTDFDSPSFGPRRTVSLLFWAANGKSRAPIASVRCSLAVGAGPSSSRAPPREIANSGTLHIFSDEMMPAINNLPTINNLAYYK